MSSISTASYVGLSTTIAIPALTMASHGLCKDLFIDQTAGESLCRLVDDALATPLVCRSDTNGGTPHLPSWLLRHSCESESKTPQPFYQCNRHLWQPERCSDLRF